MLYSRDKIAIFHRSLFHLSHLTTLLLPMLIFSVMSAKYQNTKISKSTGYTEISTPNKPSYALGEIFFLNELFHLPPGSEKK